MSAVPSSIQADDQLSAQRGLPRSSPWLLFHHPHDIAAPRHECLWFRVLSKRTISFRPNAACLGHPHGCFARPGHRHTISGIPRADIHADPLSLFSGANGILLSRGALTGYVKDPSWLLRSVTFMDVAKPAVQAETKWHEPVITRFGRIHPEFRRAQQSSPGNRSAPSVEGTKSPFVVAHRWRATPRSLPRITLAFRPARCARTRP